MAEWNCDVGSQGFPEHLFVHEAQTRKHRTKDWDVVRTNRKDKCTVVRDSFKSLAWSRTTAHMNIAAFGHLHFDSQIIDSVALVFNRSYTIVMSRRLAFIIYPDHYNLVY